MENPDPFPTRQPETGGVAFNSTLWDKNLLYLCRGRGLNGIYRLLVRICTSICMHLGMQLLYPVSITSKK